jgi:hypothetical protein
MLSSELTFQAPGLTIEAAWKADSQRPSARRPGAPQTRARAACLFSFFVNAKPALNHRLPLRGRQMIAWWISSLSWAVNAQLPAPARMAPLLIPSNLRR